MDDTLLKSIKQIEAYLHGDDSQVRVDNVQVTPIPEYDGERIKKIRKSIPVTQHVFAYALAVSPRTVEAWEAGRSRPSGSSRRLLQIIEADPQLVNQFVQVK
ncbi:antitoxin igA-2 [Lentilactobacillus sunkii]|jgi:putative transcriptional regulator|uniref:Antitoxin igA-2 n=1 Tax=Lentilactobacillus sunkii TaxID=481719 RepID=A0A1E7XIP4_9LACO|nr:transcriptional regulator [Lentilactobacillus sunkii]OFA12852.1 antitoxin igA-2 [Lentilactobacillus sunkii]